MLLTPDESQQVYITLKALQTGRGSNSANAELVESVRTMLRNHTCASCKFWKKYPNSAMGICTGPTLKTVKTSYSFVCGEWSLDE